MRVEKHGVVSNGIKSIVGVSSCLFIVGFMLFGCAAVGPDYTPPEASTPEKWNASSSGGIAYEPDALQTMAHWWTTLDDPILSSLIDRALQGSLDLRISVARVREARARRGIVNADRFPTLNATGSAIKSRSSEETGSGMETDLFDVGFEKTP